MLECAEDVRPLSSLRVRSSKERMSGVLSGGEPPTQTASSARGTGIVSIVCLSSQSQDRIIGDKENHSPSRRTPAIKLAAQEVRGGE